MKLTISHNTIILGTLAFLLIIFLIFTGRVRNSTSSQRKQEISQTAASTKNKDIREIKITAKMFSFTPDIIGLKLNEKVRFKLTTEDVAHGFYVPELNIDQPIQPGKESTVDFQATKKGTFTFLCSVPCGLGHSAMRGIIVVE